MLATLLGVCVTFSHAQADEMPCVAVSKDKKAFVLEPPGRRFVPWGFNYDHDSQGRLIEDYWEGEWATVEAHFAQMKKLGANVVRVHLQVGKFLDGPDKTNDKALDRLGKLLRLAERVGLYLDLTGLGCYHKKVCRPGTTSSPRKNAGRCKPASGRRWPNAAPTARPFSVMT
jgi:hypothetical protein